MNNKIFLVVGIFLLISITSLTKAETLIKLYEDSRILLANFKVDCSNIVGGSDLDFCTDADTGASGDSKWVDGGDFIYPNSTYADNVNVSGYVNATDLNVRSHSNINTVNVSGNSNFEANMTIDGGVVRIKLP